MARRFLLSAIFLLVVYFPINSASGHWIYMNTGKIIEAEKCWENGAKIKCRQQSKVFSVNKSDFKKIIFDIGTDKERTIIVDKSGRLVVQSYSGKRNPDAEASLQRMARNQRSRSRIPSSMAKNDGDCASVCRSDYDDCWNAARSIRTSRRNAYRNQCTTALNSCRNYCATNK